MVLYCIIVQKSPIFVQLSPIQCTYSNIFIRFFKFFPANTIIYQNSYRVSVAHCTFEITLLQAIMLTLLFVCAFSSTQVQKYLAWGLIRIPFRTSYASFLTSQSPQATIACLMLAYSFSPRVQKYPAGSPIFPTGTKYPAGSPIFRSQ